jgi:choline dehydrogenase
MAAQDTNAFDYIVVGAGSAGCVIANRLSADPNRSVLLLEAGGSDEFFTNTKFLDLPSLFSLWGPDTDWGYSTEPNPGLNGRSIPITQGKVLGGGSSTNGRIYLRGSRHDYDLWNALGNEGWSYDDVLPYFKKLEDYSGSGDSAYHGTGGPMPVMDLPDPTPISRAFMQACIDHGFKGPGDLNGADQGNVVAYCQSNTTKDLNRASTAVSYIHPIMDRKNFTLQTNAHVTRILFEGTRAVGVEYVQEGQTKTARATSEVVASAGAFNEPKLLMLSGIGPADHLRSLGIPVVVDLPGVGQNLQDHLHLTLTWRLKEKQPNPIILSEVNLFTYSRAGLDAASPDVNYMFAPFFFPWFGPVDEGITLAPTLSQPQSVGFVTIRSNDPFAAPVISPNYLSCQTDVDVLDYSLQLGEELIHEPIMDRFRGEELAPGPDIKTKEDRIQFIRNTAVTVWHPSCSCKMGRDAMSVVDPQLRVYGVTGLRVADSSIMPRIVNANLHVTTVMIGEKASDLILAAK